MPTTIQRPGADEHPPYYSGYIALVPDGPLVDLLFDQQLESLRLLRSVDDQRGLHAYAPGKWTIKQVIGHVCDAERIFTYRALRFARGDEQPLTGFDENSYVPAGRFNDRRMNDLLNEFQAIRAATIHLFRHLDEEELSRRGVANGNPITVRALGYIVAGHERHHVKLLRERYGL
jgi:uncharacterized damage-inducible protein DinB